MPRTRHGHRAGLPVLFALVTAALSALTSLYPHGAGAAQLPSVSLPGEVLQEMERLRLETERRALYGFQGSDLLPPLEDATPVEQPGWAYRNPLTAPLAVAAGNVEAVYWAGIAKLGQGALEEASYYMVRARQIRPDHRRAPEAAFWLGEIRRRQGRVAEACSSFRLVSGPLASEATYRLGRLLEAQGRVDEARAVWKKMSVERTASRQPEALVWVAWDDLLAGAPQRSLDALGEALRRVETPGGTAPSARFVGSSALFATALARRESKDLPGAEAALARLLLEAPEHPLAAAAQLALVWVLEARGKAAEAERRISAALELSSASRVVAAARYARVRLLARRGEVGAAAETIRLLDGEADPFWAASARVTLAWSRLEGAERQEAFSLLEEVVAGRDPELTALGRYLAGECLFALGRELEAKARFEEVPPASPLRAPALERAGFSALRTGRPAEALQLFERARKDFPEYSGADRLTLGAAEGTLALGRSQEALSLFRSVPAGSPARGEALYGSAAALFQLERWEESAAALEALLTRFPNHPTADEATLLLARTRLQQRMPEAALTALEPLLREGMPPGVRCEARALQGRIRSRVLTPADAKALFEALLAECSDGPSAVELHRALAELEAGTGEDSSALLHLEHASRLSPGVALPEEARSLRAELLYRLERYSEALAEYRTLRGTEASFRALECLARLNRGTELDGAVAAFEAQHAKDPRTPRALALLGAARLQAGAPGEAAIAYRRAADLATDPETASAARRALARALFAAGRQDEAVSELERVAETQSEAAVEALRELAQRSEADGMPGAALRAWDRLGARVGGRERCLALRNAARHAAAEGDPAGAETRLRAALDGAPPADVPLRQGLLSELGETLAAAGRNEEALASFRKAADAALSAEGLHALVLLAGTLEALGRSQEALETYLRMGYLYRPSEEGAARALLRAGEMLEDRGHRTRAQRLYARLRREAPPGPAAEAEKRLERMQSGVAPPPPPDPTAAERRQP